MVSAGRKQWRPRCEHFHLVSSNMSSSWCMIKDKSALCRDKLYSRTCKWHMFMFIYISCTLFSVDLTWRYWGWVCFICGVNVVSQYVLFGFDLLWCRFYISGNLNKNKKKNMEKKRMFHHLFLLFKTESRNPQKPLSWAVPFRQQISATAHNTSEQSVI